MVCAPCVCLREGAYLVTIAPGRKLAQRFGHTGVVIVRRNHTMSFSQWVVDAPANYSNLRLLFGGYETYLSVSELCGESTSYLTAGRPIILERLTVPTQYLTHRFETQVNWPSQTFQVVGGNCASRAFSTLVAKGTHPTPNDWYHRVRAWLRVQTPSGLRQELLDRRILLAAPAICLSLHRKSVSVAECSQVAPRSSLWLASGRQKAAVGSGGVIHRRS